ncbi:PRC-barrel domain-containing protein [Arthrobacter sp. H14]|uniref:PRC-barrel domain-containing protein n=1 Tax=Arthrobacter sp. H14 TaxID=1312959 RepID=UPI0004BBB7C9|nr:PRC-barrel domain-containing protein [Arthrobacter sp. H14]
MITYSQIEALMESQGTIVDSTGHKIGYLGDVYLDDKTGMPKWITVGSGSFGTHASFVPLRGAEIIEDQVCVQYSKDVIKHTPRFTVHGHLLPAQEDELYRHYGIEPGSLQPIKEGSGGEPDRPQQRRFIESDDGQETIVSSRDADTAPGRDARPTYGRDDGRAPGRDDGRGSAPGA